ncbi:MAG: TIGR03936 family radical SAM-associated protein [Anaerolineae bacterium]|nr:TIGR03936 family radical SAM-associated protein [Anaerolineae bacterium]
MIDPNQSPPNHRLRLVFAKKKQIKYIGHLDLVLAWERALRRAQIPLAYSKGFNPRPKIQVASSLPVGTTGSAEIMDIITTQWVDPAEALARIRLALPMGIELHSVEAIPLKAPTLQHLLRQADYRVMIETGLPLEELTHRIKALMAAEKVIQNRERKKQLEEIDLRPWLHELAVESVGPGEVYLRLRLSAGQFGNLRPEEVLKALGLADNWAEVDRTRLIFEGGEL